MPTVSPPSHSSSVRPILVLLAILGLVSTVAWAAEPGAEPVAEVDGKAVTMAELEASAAGELIKLDRQRHQLLERGLAAIVEERLLESEAEKSGTTVAELLATEVEAKVTPVTDDDVDAFYTQNQARIRGSKEAAYGQLHAYLTEQRHAPVRQELLGRLRKSFPVKTYLEPLRIKLDDTAAPVKGGDDASVTVVEFSDFQCPACIRATPALAELAQTYGDKVRIVFRQLPLRSIHAQAQKAAEASLCAEDQGKFWKMHDVLFESRGQLAVGNLKKHAEEIGLDMTEFEACLDSDAKATQVQADVNRAERIGVSSTPSIFINGRPVTLYNNTPMIDQLAAMVDDELERSAAGGD